MLFIIENNLNLSIDQMLKIIRKREEHIPPRLFKYREIRNFEELENDYHVDALKNENVYLNNPYFFNDPYDSAFSIDMENFKEYITKNLEKIIRRESAHFLLKQHGIDPDIVSNKEIMYQDIPVDENLIDNLFEENKNIFYNEYYKNKIKFKVCCFSEKKDSILMWSHYSNNHEGFCIEYDTSKIDEENRKELYPVFYHEILFPLMKIDDDINTGKLNSLIKYKDWRYENEWRLILNEKYAHMNPSKIYLGTKFYEKYIDFFKDIASEKNCKLYRMYMDYSKYKLEEREIKL